MGPGAALIVGAPFVVLTLSLLVLLRRERLNRERGIDTSEARASIYRAVTVALLLFVGFLIFGLIAAALTGSAV